MIDLLTLRNLRSRTRMYLPDDRFTSLVAFLVGVDASEVPKLHEFNYWLATRIGGSPSFVWWSQLVTNRHPGWQDRPEPDYRRPYDWLSPEDEAELCNDAFTYLEEFLVQASEAPPLT